MSDSRITNAAIEAAYDAHGEAHEDGQPYEEAFRAALEAALPHLAPQLVDRGALEQAIISAANQSKKYEDCTYVEGYTDEMVAAVLALLNGGQS